MLSPERRFALKPEPAERTQTGPQVRLPSTMRALTVLVFIAAFAWYVSYSVHWGMMIDTPVMHYVIFLMHHGFKPYVDITDNNMPGAYLTEALAMRLFGPGDLAWRLYEFSLLGVMAGGMAYLARRVDWAAGLFAAAIFIALHASEGPQFAAERELVVTAFLLLACVALSFSLERRRPTVMLAMGLASALAVSIKPTYLVFPLALLGIGAVVLRRKRVTSWPYLLWAAAGMLCIGVLCLGFLLYYHALPGFVFILTRVIPAYAGMTPPPWAIVFRAAIPRSVLALTLLTLPLAVVNWKRFGPWPWDKYMLALGAALGLLSYLAQRKGFPHHRYTFLVFLLLLLGMELFRALQQRMQSSGWPRFVAAAAIALMLLGFIPRSLHTGAQVPSQSELYLSLRSDLRTLGGSAQLQGKVFCFDLVYGCLNALYHEGIVENTGFTGDLLFFAPANNFATAYYRERFWDAMRRDPPQVLVVSNEDLMQDNSFDRLSRWPQLDAYLQANYVEVVRRTFAHEKFGVHQPGTLDPADQDAYRLYIRNTSRLLAAASSFGSDQKP